MKKVVQFSDYLDNTEFSQGAQKAAKTPFQGDTAKTPQSPANIGVIALRAPLHPGQLGRKPHASKKKKLGGPPEPMVVSTPGPEGYKLDCEHMAPGQLHAAYPGEYQSWKDGKSRCKQKGWPWADEWKLFKDFLFSMGPKPSPAHTLDRIDNGLGAYGPDLCRWASKTVQNNNKSDNIKIVIPLTGEVFSAQKIAVLHNVSVKSVYKWRANMYSDLEMIAGKKSKPLKALSAALSELPIAQSPKNQKPVRRQIKIPAYRPPAFEDAWEPTDDEYEHYIETGVMKGTSRHEQHRAEYDALVAWIAGHNVGSPVSPEPPQGRYFKPRLPPNAPSPNPKTFKAYIASSNCVGGANGEEDPDFDPTDCVDPDD